MAEEKKNTNAAPKAEAKTETTAKTTAKVEAKPKSAPKPKAAPKKPAAQAKKAAPKAAPQVKTAPKAETKNEAKPAEPKSAPKAATAAVNNAAQLPNDFARVIVNQLVEAQRMWLELTTQQTALVVKTVTDVMGMSDNAPTESLANWAKQGVEGFINAQKQWSEIAMQQGEKLMETVQSGASFSGGGASEVIGTAQAATSKGLETLINLRTAWLDFAEKQNKDMVSMLKQNLNLDNSSPVSAVADFAQQTMSSYVEIQKRWLDLATQMPIFGSGAKQDKK